MKVHLDFETRSCCDLKTAGAFRYSEDVTTECLILAYSLGNAEPIAVDLTKSGFMSKLTPLFEAIERGVIVCAHNAQFERLIWENVLRFPVTPKPYQWSCTAARARALAIPGSLAGAATALGLKINKDDRGMTLINLFSKPQKKGGFIEPKDRPEDFAMFMDYCKQDVRVEIELDKILPELSSVEHEAFTLDFKINQTGLPVNIDLVKRADSFVQEYSEELLTKSISISGSRPTQREKTLEYLASRGYKLPNLQAATVEAFAKTPGLPEDIIELMDSRIELSRAGTKKLKAIQNCVSSDGRIRGGFLFSAASTRRWSSTGVQVHNLQKPEGEANPEVALGLLENDPHDLRLIFDRPLTVIAQSIRAFFESKENLIVADYSSIEPRGLAWIVGQDWQLEAYFKKQDAYKITAGKLYGIPPEKVNASQRFTGKQLILGCFGPDTEVLTDSGWKKIIQVKLSDKLWDGIEYVSHSGLIDQGIKEVINPWGIYVTSNHEIWTGQQFHPVKQILEDPEKSLLKSALSSATLPSKLIGSEFQGGFCFTNAGVFAGTFPFLQKLISIVSAPDHARLVPLSLLGSHKLNLKSLSLQKFLNLKSIKKLGEFLETCTIGLSRNALVEPIGTKSKGLKSAIGGMTFPAFSKMSYFWKGGISNLFSIEKTTKEITPPKIADLSVTPNLTKTLLRVFDIKNSGPRNRFTIRCSKGALIVHNCGYGMGPQRFAESCARFGRQLTIEESTEAVQGYRQSVPKITGFWRDIEKACVRATRDWKKVSLGRFVIRPEVLANGFKVLYVDMPSGTICYPAPCLGNEEWKGTFRDTFEFYTPLGSGWVKTDTFGGSLTENIVQAIARDVLRDGLVAADKAGFKIIGHVHDEAIAEGASSKDDLKEFEYLLCNSSPWADGFPLATEGYISQRYKK